MKPVMLATDGSPTAEKATDTAIDLAWRLDTELVIVSAWDLHYSGSSAMGFAPAPMNRELARLGEKPARRLSPTPACSARAAVSELSLRACFSPSLASSRFIGAGAKPIALDPLWCKSQAVTITSSVSSRHARSMAVSVAFSAVGDPSVASITGFMTFLLRSEVAADAARELSVRPLGLRLVSRTLEPLARLE